MPSASAVEVLDVVHGESAAYRSPTDSALGRHRWFLRRYLFDRISPRDRRSPQTVNGKSGAAFVREFCSLAAVDATDRSRRGRANCRSDPAIWNALAWLAHD